MNDEKPKDIYTSEEIKEIDLNEQPEFGESLANAPRVTRFASNLGVKANLVRVQEIISQNVEAGPFSYFFRTTFKSDPSVQGTIKATDGKLYNLRFQALPASYVTFSVSTSQLTATIPYSGYLHLRVYAYEDTGLVQDNYIYGGA